MLAEGRINVKGIVPPEIAIKEPAQFFKELVELAQKTDGKTVLRINNKKDLLNSF